MYSVCKQIHPPTGIEHCVYCNFYNSWEKNLIIAGVNQLHVYRLNSEPEIGSAVQDDKPTERKTRLECLGSFSLFGNIMSLQTVKLAGSQRDALLLSFADAKLSVLEYDVGTHDLKTSSLHQFEEVDLKDGFFNPHFIPTLRVDPDGRCAAMLAFGTRMVILPFRRDVTVENLDSIYGGTTQSKSPILSSYIIDLRKFDEKISNVKDFQFLHGYYEPTIFILYEPLMTWAGRTAVRTDTCNIVAISLNLQQKVHPVIWSLGSLPFDCFMALAIPKPIGGVLVFAVNSLLYLSQSVPPYGVSLNSFVDISSSFPLRRQDVKLALDCTQACLISYDRLVLSLKGGELFVLTLVVDGMRSVRSFHFDKAASSVLTTCMCLCDDGFLFLGSRLGNSLLLKYNEKAQDKVEKVEADKKSGEPAAKKRRGEGADQLASDVSEIETLDLEVYGTSENQGPTTIASYVFEVCDNIWNIAPCGQIQMGDPAFLSEEFSSTLDPDLELVTTSGYGKNGALSVLQRSIRPQVVTTFELPGCIDMWTVFSSSTAKDETSNADVVGDGEEENKTDITGGHAYLILSRAETSMILQTGQEIMELDHSGFSTETATIFAGNIGDNNYILQVSTNGVRLLEGVKQLQVIPMDMGSPIISCSIADPYILIMSEEGQIMLLTLKEDSYGSGVRLAVIKPQNLTENPKILAMCTYKDISGLFTTSSIKGEEERPVDKPSKSTLETVLPMDHSTIDDEDELLYGESDTSVFTSSFDLGSKDSGKDKKQEPQVQEVKPSHWCIITRENGVLEVFTLPDFKICYYVKNFPVGQKVLVDSVHVADSISKPSSSSNVSSGDKNVAEIPVVQELLMVGLGHNKTKPYLLARVESTLLIYEAFPFQQSQQETSASGQKDNRLKVRFKKINHSLIAHEKKKSKKKSDGEEKEEESKKLSRVTQLRYFEDVSGYSGVFICGPYPHWLFMTSKGSPRIHPMGIDGPVKSFSSFHNVNCPRGFLYFNRQGELRICVLPTHVTYDAPWPIRKVPLRCTPLFLCYHAESKTYAVVTNIPEPCNKLPKTTTDEREWDVLEKDDRSIYPLMDRYTMQLFTPSSWEVIPNCSYETEEWEQVTVLKTVMLKSEGTMSGVKGYIAMGTNFSLGEENVSRGKIIIFDVIEVVPLPGQPLTKTRFKLIYEREQKGPLTALAHLNGLLVSAIGQKIYIWSLKDNDLSGVAFIDTHIYIQTLNVVKNLILAGDLLKSITVYRFQEALRVLSIVSRDVKPLEVYATEFLIDNTSLSFLVSDRNKNIFVYQYHPEARESHGGQRLVRKADFNIGSHINSMFRVCCKLADPTSEKSRLAAKRQVTFFATLDGSLGFLLPLSEKVYRRLFMLQNALTVHIPHTAGLNPKTYRAVKMSFPDLSNPQKNILDGELLWKFLHLNLMERNELSRRIGTSTDQILDDLLEIDRLTAHF
ncbi:cleavage and polyadenylation specificity factor subunit 1-like isoform X2 [Gigantopelta aegis]|uniref:cleavage and polyadenylation specificity factor subunit 1-like isoform X2 n=1 Tax=Gigantopelta aegis TaxID=1735272 RepID=UPI001B887719|nr:cleavage and polyadenylation specificity factor subunit 1-like isoform X2 [Gigantopelta aegis]